MWKERTRKKEEEIEKKWRNEEGEVERGAEERGR